MKTVAEIVAAGGSAITQCKIAQSEIVAHIVGLLEEKGRLLAGYGQEQIASTYYSAAIIAGRAFVESEASDVQP